MDIRVKVLTICVQIPSWASYHVYMLSTKLVTVYSYYATRMRSKTFSRVKKRRELLHFGCAWKPFKWLKAIYAREVPHLPHEVGLTDWRHIPASAQVPFGRKLFPTSIIVWELAKYFATAFVPGISSRFNQSCYHSILPTSY